MTRERAKELLPIIEAFANGADVQVHRIGNVWLTLTEPDFVDDALYRIKPKPLEVWAVVEADGVWTYGGTREAVDAQLDYRIGRGGTARIVKLVEVVE